MRWPRCHIELTTDPDDQTQRGVLEAILGATAGLARRAKQRGRSVLQHDALHFWVVGFTVTGSSPPPPRSLGCLIASTSPISSHSISSAPLCTHSENPSVSNSRSAHTHSSAPPALDYRLEKDAVTPDQFVVVFPGADEQIDKPGQAPALLFSHQVGYQCWAQR